MKRIPEQERPKSRGEGTTQQKPTAELHQLADDGSEELLVPSRISEANSRIIELTGLSAEQFRQVMVLPQGKFRELLLADSQDREKIFRQLFQTQIYSKLEHQLKERANHISREVTKLKQHQASILTTVEMEDSETLKDELTRLKRKIKKLKKKKSSADEQHTNAIKALSRGQQLEQQFKELDVMQKAQAELLQQEEGFKKKNLTKDLAEHANTLRPLFDQLEKAKQAGVLADGKLATAKALANKTANEVLDKKTAKEKADQKKPDLEQQKKQQVQLEKYRERSQQLSAAREKLKQKEQALTAAESQQKASQQKLITQKEELAELEKNKDALSKQSIRLPKVQNQLQQVERIIGLREKLDLRQADSQQLSNQLAVAESELSRAKSNLAEPSQDRELLEQRWQAGQAAILGCRNHPIS
jgi:exonuclease SbcC